MKTYLVRLPITGSVDVEIEADNEDAAIEAALNSEISIDDITEWDVCKQIVTGNVFWGIINEAEAEEIA